MAGGLGSFLLTLRRDAGSVGIAPSPRTVVGGGGRRLPLVPSVPNTTARPTASGIATGTPSRPIAGGIAPTVVNPSLSRTTRCAGLGGGLILTQSAPRVFPPQRIVPLPPPVLVAPFPTLITALGTRLRLNFTGNYANGTWTDDVAGNKLSQATAATRPTTAATTCGNPVLSFSGTQNVAAAAGLAAIASLPARGSGGNGQRIFGGVFNTSHSGFSMPIWKSAGTTYVGLDDPTSTNDYRFVCEDDNDTSAHYALSTGNPADGAWHRVFIVGDDTAGSTTVYLDGVAQTVSPAVVGSFVTDGYFGYDWNANSQTVGTGDGVSWTGQFGDLFWAYTSTTFNTADLASIDAALLAYIVGVPIHGTVAVTLQDATVTAFGSAATSGGTNYSQSISESVSAPADGVDTQQVLARAVAESSSQPTDAIATQQVLARTIGETVAAPTDAVVGLKLHLGNVSESLSAPTDAVPRAFSGARALADSTAAPTDAITRAVADARSVAESVSAPTDAVTRALAEARTVAETVAAPTDTVTRAFTAHRGIAEAVAATTDVVARVLTLTRTIAESDSAPTDALTRAYAGFRSIGETVSAPTDAVTGIHSGGGSHSGNVSESTSAPTDAVVRVFVGSRSVAASVAAPTDAVTRGFGVSRALGESTTALTDAISRTVTAARAIADSTTASTDSLARTATVARQISVAVAAPADGATHSLGVSRAVVAETVSAADSVAVFVTFSRTAPETLGRPVDVVTRIAPELYPRSVGESVVAPSDVVNWFVVLAGTARVWATVDVLTTISVEVTAATGSTTSTTAIDSVEDQISPATSATSSADPGTVIESSIEND